MAQGAAGRVSEKRRMIFMGSDPIALPALEFLTGSAVDRVEVMGVFTQPDRPAGRGKKLKSNGIKQWALARGIEVRQPERLGEEDVAWLRERECDLILVMAYGQILRRAVIDLPPLGTYNLHASLLPQYRGASPIQAALASGDAETGVTLMRMVRRLDAGPAVDREAFPVDRLETGETAERKMADACVPLLARNLDRLVAGDVLVQEQDEASATFCRKLEKKDGELDFAAPAEVLAKRINALHPWPGCFVTVKEQRVRVGLADWSDEAAAVEPGTVVESQTGELRVATGKGTLKLLQLQRPGGRMLEASEFLRGFPISAGARFPSQTMSMLVAKQPFPIVRK